MSRVHPIRCVAPGSQYYYTASPSAPCVSGTPDSCRVSAIIQSGKRHTSIRFQGGFTLMELMVVLAILSAMMVVVFPRLNLGEDETRTEARRAASLLRAASEEASMRKETLSLKFDLDARTIGVIRSTEERPELFNTFTAVETPSRGMVREGSLTVPISPMGAVEHIIVHLGADREPGFIVTLNSISGRVKVKELDANKD